MRERTKWKKKVLKIVRRFWSIEIKKNSTCEQEHSVPTTIDEREARRIESEKRMCKAEVQRITPQALQCVLSCSFGCLLDYFLLLFFFRDIRSTLRMCVSVSIISHIQTTSFRKLSRHVWPLKRSFSFFSLSLLIKSFLLRRWTQFGMTRVTALKRYTYRWGVTIIHRFSPKNIRKESIWLSVEISPRIWSIEMVKAKRHI